MSTEDTRRVIEEYYEALRRNDRSRLLDLLAPNCRWKPPRSAPLEEVVGAEAVAAQLGSAVIKTLFDLSQPFHLDVRRVLADGDVAVVQQRIRATAKATGAAYDNEYCWVYELRDGRIALIEEYADTVIASAAFGWGGER